MKTTTTTKTMNRLVVMSALCMLVFPLWRGTIQFISDLSVQDWYFPAVSTDLLVKGK